VTNKGARSQNGGEAFRNGKASDQAMGDTFSADDFWAAAQSERIKKCRQMAAEAEMLAANAGLAFRAHYIELAKEWTTLADEMEKREQTKTGP
jgi:hypothetical protein